MLADYGGKDLWKRRVSSLEWNSECVMEGESGERVAFLHFIHRNEHISMFLDPRFDPTPHPSATALRHIFFNLSIYCQLYKGFQDPASFTVTTGLLGRLGLGLRVRVSIRIIFTCFHNLL